MPPTARLAAEKPRPDPETSTTESSYGIPAHRDGLLCWELVVNAM